MVDCEKVAAYDSGLSDVVLSRHNSYTCSEPGQKLIKKDIEEHRLNRVVVASCSPRPHEPTFRQCVTEAALKARRISRTASLNHRPQPTALADRGPDGE